MGVGRKRAALGHAAALTLLCAVVSCGGGDDDSPAGAGRGGQGGTAGEPGAGKGGSGKGGSGKGGATASGGSGARPDAGSGGDAGASGEAGSAAGRGGSDESGGTGAGEGGAAGGPAVAPFTVMVEPSDVSLPRGASGWLTVRVARRAGFDEPITVRFDALPAGLVADTLVLPNGVESGVLALSSSADIAERARFELDITASSGGQATIASLDVAISSAQPSAQEAIRAALAAGALDYETSLRYRAYALTGDARLPEEFRGAGSEEEDNGLFVELAQQMPQLSAQAQTALRPYLVRPTASESIWQAPASARLARVGAHRLAAFEPGPFPAACPPESGTAGTWISQRSAAEPVRVWAQCQGTPEGDAESVRLIDRTLSVLHKVYGPLTSLMTAPIADEGGADSAIDFYIVDPGRSVVRRGEGFSPAGLGSTYGDFPEVGNGTSAFVTLPRFLAYTGRFHSTVIHELFHVVQKAYNATYAYREVNASNVYSAHWFPEASAVWAAAHFDRTLAPWPDGRGAYLDAHARFIQRFQPSHAALNAPEPVPHTYAAYVWPYFVEQATEGASFMRAIWEGIAGATTFEQADDAIDAAYPFREHFKDFALRNLNMALTPGDPLPERSRHVALDSIFPDGHPPPFVEAELSADQDFRQELELPNLAARYVSLTVDADVNKVELDFSGLQPAEQTDVYALVQTIDGWVAEPLDFSDEEDELFCFDKGPATVERRGRFERMILVLANHGTRAGSDVSGELVVKPSSEPCTTVWQGTITMDYSAAVSGGTVTSSSSVSVVFELDDTLPPSSTVFYRLRSGTYTYDWLGDYSERSVPCRTHEAGSGAMIADMAAVQSSTPGAAMGQLDVHTLFDPVTYAGSGFGIADSTLTTNCNDNNIDQTYDWASPFTWWQTGSAQHTVSPDGNTLQGTYEAPDGTGGAYRYDWLLTRVDE